MDNLFITGGAGTGKSHLLRQIADRLTQMDIAYAMLAPTGIAAVNIGGRTIHSFFGFGTCKTLDELVLHDKKPRNRSKMSARLKAISACRAVMIDEISMVSGDMMQMISYRLQQARFNGAVLLCGDFYQLPPVRDTQAQQQQTQTLFESGGYYGFESEFWRTLNPSCLELHKSYRTSDQQFVQLLNALRLGVISQSDEELLVRLSQQKQVLELEPTHLYSTNFNADNHNYAKLRGLRGEMMEYEALLFAADGVDQWAVESFFKALTTPSLLTLKVGARVLFTVNNQESYYNGERGTVLEMDDEVIVVEKDDGVVLEVLRYEFNLEEPLSEKVLASLKQFPLRLAWAITIHKSQGMGIKPLVVDVDRMFENGQLYVALSRSIDPAQLLITSKFDALAAVRRSITPNRLVDSFYADMRQSAKYLKGFDSSIYLSQIKEAR